MARHSCLLVVVATLIWFTSPAKVSAWGYDGHKIIAAIARTELTPAVRAKVDAILATDADTLTAPDMIARSTWADALRAAGHRETAAWHYADVELARPDLNAACFGFAASGGIASRGPANDCLVHKVEQFRAELADPASTPAERLVALKFILHFMGDLHQPLHMSDNRDRGGNCVLLALGGSRAVNLHSFWDGVVLKKLGSKPEAIAARLESEIGPRERAVWAKGSPRIWAMESFHVSTASAYTIGSAAGCGQDRGPLAVPAGYEDQAAKAAALQLKRAGVRLALVLNQTLAAVRIAPMSITAPRISTAVSMPGNRTPLSIACSEQADHRQLHGQVRKAFRRACMRAL